MKSLSTGKIPLTIGHNGAKTIAFVARIVLLIYKGGGVLLWCFSYRKGFSALMTLFMHAVMSRSILSINRYIDLFYFIFYFVDLFYLFISNSYSSSSRSQ